MPSKSKTKGSNGEREICKLLSDIFGGSFVRVPSSGAQVGGTNAHRLEKYSDTQGRAFRGDVIPPDNLPNLYIEAKSYKDFRFHQLLQPMGSPILDTWIKQVDEGKVATDVWFICYKISRVGWYIAMPEDACADYAFENYCEYLSPSGRVRVTDMLSFFRNNYQLIAKRAA